MAIIGLDSFAPLAKQYPLSITPSSFYFLRHGQTPRNAAKIYQTYDEPLSELGEQQAADAAAALRSAPVPVRTIVSSDAKRTLQTADAASAALGLDVDSTPLLKERHFGELWGTSSARIDWDYTPAGGESLEEFVKRTRDGLDYALNSRQEEPVLIVAHGGNLIVLAHLLELPIDYKLFGNALPLFFSREGHKWSAQPLLAAGGSAEGPNMA